MQNSCFFPHAMLIMKDKLSTILLKYRTDKGLTQEAMAEKLGVTVRSYFNFEDGSLDNNVVKTNKYLNILTGNFQEKKGIPIYQVSAQASLMDHINQLPEIPSFHIDLPGYQDCDFGLYVFGECMAPTITSGSLVICKRIKDKSIIMYGEIYVVRTSDYLIIKRITKAKKESHILLVCDNFTDNEDFSNRYAPVELSRDEIKELFLVKGIVKKTQS